MPMRAATRSRSPAPGGAATSRSRPQPSGRSVGRPERPLDSIRDPALLPAGDGRDLVGGGEARAVARGRARRARGLGRGRARFRARPSRRSARAPSRRRPSAWPRSRRGRSTTSPRSSMRWPSELGDEGRWFHYGLTSSDVVDTALALQIREAGALVLAGHRARAGRRDRARRGAPRDAHDRPHARHPRRADDVRSQARRLGVRARARARPRRARARRDAGREALRRGRHVRGLRSRGRARSRASGSGSSRRRARRRSCSATATPRC